MTCNNSSLFHWETKETRNFEAFHSLEEMQVFSRTCLLHNLCTAVCYRHYSHCTGTATPCSKPVTAMNQVCVCVCVCVCIYIYIYIWHRFEHIAHRIQTYTNPHVKYPVHCSSVTNVYSSLQKTHTHITDTSRVQHKCKHTLEPSCTSNVDSLTHTHTHTHTHTQIYGAIRRTRVTTRNRLSGYQHNKHTQISATRVQEPHANKTAAKRKVAVTDIQEVAILQGFLPNTTRAFLFSRTRVTGVARITSLT